MLSLIKYCVPRFPDFTIRFDLEGTPDYPFGTIGAVKTAMGNGITYVKSVIQQTNGKLLAVGRSFVNNYDIGLVRYNLDGSLDTTFDTDGIVSTVLEASNDAGNSVIRQRDGKLVVVGKGFRGSNDFAIARYNTDGSLDNSFHSDGIATRGFSPGSPDVAQSVIQQSDGRLIIAGYSNFNGQNYVALTRLKVDGNYDSNFGGGNGFVVTPIGSADVRANAVIQQADGKLLVAGSHYTFATNNSFALIRYLTNGDLDTTFDGNGVVASSISGGAGFANSVLQQADGQLVVAGVSNSGTGNDVTLIRYNLNGSIDTSFGVGGLVVTDFGGSDVAYSVIQQADGQLVVAGTTFDGNVDAIVLARYNSDGSLDTSFNNNGFIIKSIDISGDQAYSVVQQSDGKLVVAADSLDSDGGQDFVLVRYNIDGSLDTSFDNNGVFIIKKRFRMKLGQGGITYHNGVFYLAGTADNDFILAKIIDEEAVNRFSEGFKVIRLESGKVLVLP